MSRSCRGAASGRRYRFRELDIKHGDRVRPASALVRLLDCEFPVTGTYIVEFWYGGEWVVDQRLEVF